MRLSQAPIPDLAALQGLDPGVAYAVLAVVTLGMVLFYLGPSLRDWLRPGRSTPQAGNGAPGETLSALPTALPAAIDRADVMSDRYIAHLEALIVDRDRVITEQDRELERQRLDAERLRDQQQQWRRGGP